MTPQDLNDIFKHCFSPRGSNARETEELIILNWTDSLFEAKQCGVDLGKILSFATGMSKVPPMGFPMSPAIHFISGDDPRALPIASTCSLTLGLPLALSDYDNFKEGKTMAVLNTVRFGQI